MRMKTAFLLTLLPLSAYAHPGEHHGDWLALMRHLLSQPDHVAMLVIAVLAGISGAYLYYRRNRH